MVNHKELSRVLKTNLNLVSLTKFCASERLFNDMCKILYHLAFSFMTSYILEIPLLLVREIRNLVMQKSGNFTFFDLWILCFSFIGSTVQVPPLSEISSL